MNHSFVFVLVFTCLSFEFCGCFAFCFFLTFCFYFVFLFCVFFLYFRFGIQRCVSVSYSRVSVLGLGFPFWLACFCFEFMLSAFEFCGLSVSCSIEYKRRRFEAKSPRANGLMQESYTAKYDNLSCKICTGYTIRTSE